MAFAMGTGSIDHRSCPRAPRLGRCAQLRAEYSSLQRRIPLIYAVALANVVGLHMSAGGRWASFESPILPLVALMSWRLRHWHRQKNRSRTCSQIASELRKTLVFAVLLAGGFSAWAQFLLTDHPEATHSIVFFGGLAAIGCTYALSSHLPAAGATLLLLGVPIAVRLLFSGDATLVGMGTSLLLVMGLTWRLLRVQNRTIVELVSSRLGVEQENRRAQSAEMEARRLATVDVLTESANRRALLEALAEAEAAGCPSVLALIDLDGFKPINDAFGHHTGDLVLKRVSARLERCFGTNALVARMGGDEFAIFWRSHIPPDPVAFGTEICKAIANPMVVEHRPLRVLACCGVVACDSNGWTGSDLLSQADLALYAAKARGKGEFVIFSERLLKLQQRRAAIERALGSGAAEAEVRVVFQPICDLRRRVVAFEALARWTNPVLGLIEPSEFIPAAEQMDVIGRLTARTLEIALECAVNWPKELRLSFNVSAMQLCELGAADRLLATMQKVGFDPRRFQMEVTETALLADFQLARENVSVLRAAGAMIALDDFGAGHASISYLREMSFDVVKLDGSLVTGLASSVQNKHLLKGVIDLCRSLGVQCVAEHVETAEQFEILRKLGCDFVQGYFVGRPDEDAQLLKLLPSIQPIHRKQAA